MNAFNREKELKLFAADIKNFDRGDDISASQHSRFTIPLYYKRLKMKDGEVNVDNAGI